MATKLRKTFRRPAVAKLHADADRWAQAMVYPRELTPEAARFAAEGYRAEHAVPANLHRACTAAFVRAGRDETARFWARAAAGR